MSGGVAERGAALPPEAGEPARAAPGRPLEGRRVIVTRAEGQGDRLAAHLRAAGAAVVEVPLIAIEPVAGDLEIHAAVERLRRRPAPRWVAVTSANAAARLRALAAEELSGIAVAAVGEATARALAAAGREADLVAAGRGGEELAAALLRAGAGGGSVWLPQAAAARPELADRLRAAGARVEVTTCYRTVRRRDAGPALAAALGAGVALVLLSPSAAAAAVAAVGVGALRGATLVCGGATTAAALRGRGLTPVVAEGPGPAQLATALVGALRG